MAEESIRKELEALRTQVAELAAMREAEVKLQAQNESESTEAESEEAPSESTGLDVQIENLIETLGEDIKETKPATLLVVFALGVLVGRLLPR